MKEMVIQYGFVADLRKPNFFSFSEINVELK